MHAFRIEAIIIKHYLYNLRLASGWWSTIDYKHFLMSRNYDVATANNT